MHTAQLKEVEEREKMLIIQEKRAEDDRLQREERARAKQKMKLADRVQKWHDSDDPEAFFARFETAMNQCIISNEEWLGRLVNCLAGKALAVYRCRTRGTDEETYEALKEKILVALGHGLQQTRKKFWNPSRKYLDMPMDALRTLDSSYSRYTRDCVDMNALREELLTGRLLSLYPWDIADIIYTRNPASSYEAAEFLQSYLDNHPWRKNTLDVTRHREVSGFGGGVGVADGDPGMGGGKSYRENHSKKGYFKKEYSRGQNKVPVLSP